MAETTSVRLKRGPASRRQATVLGQQLKEEREHQNLTQRSVAQAVGCYELQVRQCENGQVVWWVLPAYIDLLKPAAPKGWETRIARALWGEYEEAIWEKLEDPVCRIYYVAKALDEISGPGRTRTSARGLGNRWTIEQLMKSITKQATAASGNQAKKPEMAAQAVA